MVELNRTGCYQTVSKPKLLNPTLFKIITFRNETFRNQNLTLLQTFQNQKHFKTKFLETNTILKLIFRPLPLFETKTVSSVPSLKGTIQSRLDNPLGVIVLA